MACFGDDLFDFVDEDTEDVQQVLPEVEEVSKDENDKWVFDVVCLWQHVCV